MRLAVTIRLQWCSRSTLASNHTDCVSSRVDVSYFEECMPKSMCMFNTNVDAIS